MKTKHARTYSLYLFFIKLRRVDNIEFEFVKNVFEIRDVCLSGIKHTFIV